jgi:2'-5' RNA ligase
MIRLFTAIQLPEDLCVSLGLMCGGIPGARWITPDRMHVTLRFIGEVEEPVFEDIRLGLSGIDGQALTLSVRGIGTFGDKKPRAIYAGVERTEPLVRLKQKIDAALMKIGIKAEDERKFTPHITLARISAQAHHARIGVFLETHGLFSAEPFDVEEFHLISSVLSGEGSIYTIEETYPLC